MRYGRVKFANFVVDADKTIETLPQFQKPFWEKEWSLVLVEHDKDFSLSTTTPNMSLSVRITEWLKREAQGQWDTCVMNHGYMVAFEDETDSILFKISIGAA